MIIHYLLLRKGEHPLYPEWGLPDHLFKPIGQIGKFAFCEIIRQEILSLNTKFQWQLRDVIVNPLETPDEPTTFYINIQLVSNNSSSDFLEINYANLVSTTTNTN